MSIVQNRHAGRFVHAAALHADEAVLDHVDAADAVAAADLIELFHNAQRRELLAVHGDRHALLERNRDRFHFVRRGLRRHRHAEVDQFDAVDHQVFQLAGFVADVQAVLVARIRLRRRRLHRDVPRVAELDHRLPAREQLAELLDPPRRNNMDAWVERFGGQLEAALIVPLAGGAVGIGVGLHFAGHFEAGLRDERASDRGAEQVHAFVLRLPLQHGEGEVAAEFFASVDDPRALRAALLGLVENRLAIFARLPEVDVGGMHLVALFLQPTENDRSIETAGVSQYAARHGSKPSMQRARPRTKMGPIRLSRTAGHFQGRGIPCIG